MVEGGTTDPLEVFGLRLRELRRERGLSQFALAEAAGLDHSYVSNCERGRLNITLRNIHKLAAALAVSPEDLLKPPTRTPEGS